MSEGLVRDFTLPAEMELRKTMKDVHKKGAEHLSNSFTGDSGIDALVAGFNAYDDGILLKQPTIDPDVSTIFANVRTLDATYQTILAEQTKGIQAQADYIKALQDIISGGSLTDADFSALAVLGLHLPGNTAENLIRLLYEEIDGENIYNYDLIAQIMGMEAGAVPPALYTAMVDAVNAMGISDLEKFISAAYLPDVWYDLCLGGPCVVKYTISPVFAVLSQAYAASMGTDEFRFDNLRKSDTDVHASMFRNDLFSNIVQNYSKVQTRGAVVSPYGNIFFPPEFKLTHLSEVTHTALNNSKLTIYPWDYSLSLTNEVEDRLRVGRKTVPDCLWLMQFRGTPESVFEMSIHTKAAEMRTNPITETVVSVLSEVPGYLGYAAVDTLITIKDIVTGTGEAVRQNATANIIDGAVHNGNYSTALAAGASTTFFPDSGKYAYNQVCVNEAELQDRFDAYTGEAPFGGNAGEASAWIRNEIISGNDPFRAGADEQLDQYQAHFASGNK